MQRRAGCGPHYLGVVDDLVPRPPDDFVAQFAQAVFPEFLRPQVLGTLDLQATVGLPEIRHCCPQEVDARAAAVPEQNDGLQNWCGQPASGKGDSGARLEGAFR